jgi:hypothetical protein
MLSTTQAADTPAAILADYRKAADTALVRVNATLDTEAAKVSKTLLALNDPAAVQSLADQVQAKRAGEPVAQPVPQASALFAAYDRARAAALTPVQQTTLRRIESVLASSAGHKTEIVAELAKLKTDVQAGMIPTEAPKVPVEWTYHGSPTSTSNIAEVHFLPNGNWEMVEAGRKIPGTWKSNKKGDKITIKLADAEWKVSIDGTLATVDRPDVGIRYLRVKGSPVGK